MTQAVRLPYRSLIAPTDLFVGEGEARSGAGYCFTEADTLQVSLEGRWVGGRPLPVERSVILPTVLGLALTAVLQIFIAPFGTRWYKYRYY